MPDSGTAGLMVVFDVDDTLYLEREYVASGFNALDSIVKAQYGKNGFAELAWRHFEDGRRGNIFDLTLTGLGIPADPGIVGLLVDNYRNHRPAISLHADADSALTELAAEGISIGILTDGPAASQTNKVAALGLSALADIAIVTDLYGPGFGKPHVRGFREIQERSGCDHHIYIADNPTKDFIGPRSLGWSTIRIIRDGGLHRNVASSSDVDVEITSLHGLLARCQAYR